MYPHVKYELEKLEKLISSGVDEPDLCETYHTDKERRIMQLRFRDEIARVKHTFIVARFTFKSEQQLERYVHYHQQELIRLMDDSYSLLLWNGSEGPFLLDDYHYSLLEKLLSFISQHFSKYFDQDAKTPASHLLISQVGVEENLEYFQQKLAEGGAAPTLADLILSPLRILVSPEAFGDTTYRNLTFAKEIQKQLFRLIDEVNEYTDINENLRFVFLYLNFNSEEVFTYHTRYIDEISNSVEHWREKIEKLSFIRKKISQASVKPGISYHHEWPSLKNKLHNYVTDEIEHLERLQGPSIPPPPPTSEKSIQDFKFKLEMSVAQAAFLLRLMIDTGIILNKNIAELLRITSSITMTKRSESISAGSFRSKFYDVERSTKESVRDLLLKMIGTIDK